MPKLFRKVFVFSGLLLAFMWVVAGPAVSQVQLPPAVKQQYFDANGRPLAGGCVFSYMSGTTTPLATYTDFTGGTPNSNPVILGSDGRPPNDIWLLGQAYRLKLVSAGGVSCSTGTQIYVEDGINPSSASLLSSNNVWTGTNTFNGTSNFNGPVNLNVGFTSLGPNTLGGGGSISGTYSGSPTLSGTWNFQGATFAGEVDAQNVVISGQLFSTNTTMPPFVVMSNQLVTNLNANLLEGADWPSPGTIGTTAPNIGVFTQLQANTSFKLNGSSTITSVQGTDVKLLSAGTFTGGTGAALCKDSLGGATTIGCVTSGISQIEAVTKSSNCDTGSSTYDSCSDVITWGTAFADSGYIAVCSGVGPSTVSGSSPPAGTLNPVSQTASSITVQTQTQRSEDVTFASINCHGIHP